MTENERITQEIEPILKEITRTLATFHIANALKEGLIYKAELNGAIFTLSFTIDAEQTRKNMAGSNAVRVN